MSVTVGMQGRAECTVTPENTAAAVGSGLVPVFATPYMVALMENAAVNAVQAALEEGQGTVGTRLEVTHDAATPIGMKVWAQAEVTAVEGKKITLKVEAFDEAGPIGGGVHERFIITVDRFLAKAEAKKGLCSMSIEKGRAYLTQRGYGDRIQEFTVSSATVELAAQAVGCEPAHIAKTLSFAVGEGCVLIVCAGDAKIDNSKFKQMFHCKATMLTPEQVEAFTGHAVGGVCPFGITREDVTTYLDISLQRFETVYPAAGNAASAVRLNCEELYELSNSAGWIDVCKNWSE